jgi:hypothetical protein
MLPINVNPGSIFCKVYHDYFIDISICSLFVWLQKKAQLAHAQLSKLGFPLPNGKVCTISGTHSRNTSDISIDSLNELILL